jgi:hypothetical protein
MCRDLAERCYTWTRSDALFIGDRKFRLIGCTWTGVITLGEIMEILPFEDPLVVLELDGEALWGAFEESLERWPALEGSVLHPNPPTRALMYLFASIY